MIEREHPHFAPFPTPRAAPRQGWQTAVRSRPGCWHHCRKDTGSLPWPHPGPSPPPSLATPGRSSFSTCLPSGERDVNASGMCRPSTWCPLAAACSRGACLPTAESCSRTGRCTGSPAPEEGHRGGVLISAITKKAAIGIRVNAVFISLGQMLRSVAAGLILKANVN